VRVLHGLAARQHIDGECPTASTSSPFPITQRFARRVSRPAAGEASAVGFLAGRRRGGARVVLVAARRNSGPAGGRVGGCGGRGWWSSFASCACWSGHRIGRATGRRRSHAGGCARCRACCRAHRSACCRARRSAGRRGRAGGLSGRCRLGYYERPCQQLAPYLCRRPPPRP